MADATHGLAQARNKVGQLVGSRLAGLGGYRP